MSGRQKKTEVPYVVSIQLDQNRDNAMKKDYYLPGQTISGSVTFAFTESSNNNNNSKEENSKNTKSGCSSDASIRSIRLVAIGKEQLERGKLTPEMLVDHVYYKRVITLAGMQEKEEQTKKEELRKRLATYIRKNGSHNPLSGVVLNTHAVVAAAAAAPAIAATAAGDDSSAARGRSAIEFTDEQQHNFYATANAQAAGNAQGRHDAQGPARRDASFVQGGELRDDEIMLLEDDSVDYPLAFPHPATARGSSASTAAYRLELDRSQTYTFSFALLLPPWVPPSFHFDRDYVGSMRYTISVDVVPASAPPPSKDGKTVSLRPVPVATKNFYVCAAVPKRELLQAHERSNLKPYFSLTQRLRIFPSNALVRFFSNTPKGLLDVRVQFISSTILVLRDAKDQRVAQLFGCATPAGGGEGWNASASSSSAIHADPAAGVTVTGAVVSATSAASAGLTSVSAASAGSSHLFVEPTAPLRVLRLRVTVANGGLRNAPRSTSGGGGSKGESITKVKVELLEHIKVRAYSSEQPGDDTAIDNSADAEGFRSLYDYNCPPIRISKCTLRGNVPYGEQNTFDAELPLPPRFHHGESHLKKTDDADGGRGKSGKSKLNLSGQEDDKAEYRIPPPPTNIQTQRVRIATELRVSFPELRTIAEEAAPRNVVVLSEYMDLNDIVPFLPNEFNRVA